MVLSEGKTIKHTNLHCFYKSFFLHSAVIEIFWNILLKEEQFDGLLYMTHTIKADTQNRCLRLK